MKLDMGVEPNETGKNKLIITVKSPLFPRYFNDLKHIVEENERNIDGLPSDIRVRNSGQGEALITFSIDHDPIESSVPGRSMVKLNGKHMESINVALNIWVNVAMKQELNRVEFIPLHGYSAEDLKKDVQTAVANKRDLCIIRTYAEYLNSQKAKTAKDAFTFVQYLVKYGSDEYSDVAIALYNKELKELRQTYENKLVQTEWV